MITTNILAVLLQEKEDIESNLRFLDATDINIMLTKPNGNQYMYLPEDEQQEIFATVIAKRQQRLDDINGLFTTIDIELKELSDKCPELLSVVSSAEKSSQQ